MSLVDFCLKKWTINIMNIESKYALITGGIQGIGLDIGKALLRNKLEKLCIIDIFENEATIEELRKEYPGKTIIFQKCDVTKKEEIENCFKLVFGQFQRFDIIVNSAGIFNDKNVEQTIMVNVVGVINSSLCGMEYMSTANGGTGGFIVNISSIAGLGPVTTSPVYTSSKWAVLGFTRSMGQDFHYNRTGVKYIAICPGVTLTNLYNKLTDKLICSEFKTVLEERMKNFIFQDIATTGNSVVEALATDKNGSVFVCDHNIIREIQLNELTHDLVFQDG